MANYVSKYTGAQIDAAVDKTGELDGKVATLSEEIGSQTSPEIFGAKGDGTTDDAEAITQAFASGQNVVFDGSKTYAVGSTITIPADAHVDFRGATIVPMENHDVIRVMSGSHIQNLVVRCTDVTGWDSSAMVFSGSDGFHASNPTRINNVKLYNDVTYNDGVFNTGNGLYLYVDEPGQFVEGLAITDLMTHGFGKGVYIRGMDATAEFEVDTVAFIGANNFNKYWSFKDTYGIYIASDHEQDRITTNFFTDMNIQSDSYGGTKYGIYCNGFANLFNGCLYDFFWTNPNDPIKAIYFDKRSNTNVVETMAGTVYDTGYVTDLGIRNSVVNITSRGKIQIPNSSNYGIAMLGNQDDILAYADKNMDCTLESLDSEPYYGNLSNVFDPTPYKVLSYAEPVSGNSTKRARITINFKKAVKEITNFVLQFVLRSEPTNIKVTLYGDSEVRTIYDVTDNQNHTVIINPVLNNYTRYDSGVQNVAKIVVEISGFHNQQGTSGRKEWALERIAATGSDALGNAWMRKNGDKVFGNVEFAENYGPVVTGANGKRYMLTVSAEGTLLPVEMPDAEDDSPDVAVLIPTMAAGAAWFDADLAGVEQSEITSVSFNADYVPTGTEEASWFCDEGSSGHIIAYRTGTEIVIVPTTGSENICLNVDSTYMFANDGTNANFAALASITGTAMLVANSNTSMRSICAKNTALTEAISIPVGVNDLRYAFQNCTSLTLPPELPEGMTNLLSAFIGCSGLQYLPDVPSTVTNMNYTFQGCTAATRAPSVIPAKVSSMESTFRACNNIDGTIEINAANLNNYATCFLSACSNSGAIVLTGSCPLLAELAATNTAGKVTVA